jgi:glc operon protein GlcG
MYRSSLLAAGACLIMSTAAPSGQTLPTRSVLTLEAARTMAAAAEAEARTNGWNVAIAVVDDGGRLLLFQRGHEVMPAAGDIAIGKAKTAAAWRRETRLLEDEVSRGGRNALLAVEGMMPLQGGIPVVVDGTVIGAIGVSGVTGAQDAQCAQAGVKALMESRK